MDEFSRNSDCSGTVAGCSCADDLVWIGEIEQRKDVEGIELAASQNRQVHAPMKDRGRNLAVVFNERGRILEQIFNRQREVSVPPPGDQAPTDDQTWNPRIASASSRRRFMCHSNRFAGSRAYA